jgi:hypothetical protein
MKRILLLVFIISALYSCSKDNTTTPPNGDPAGYRYFPIDTGHWVTYNYDSIAIGLSGSDTFNFQVMEYIQSTFLDNSGQLTERIERYIMVNDTSSWRILNVWTSNLHPNDAERVEDNVRFIKLAFPVVLGATWNGNAFNNIYPEWDYSYTSVDQPLTIGSLSFDSTLTVLQVNNNNLVQQQYGVEQYAKGVGMIYKEFKNDSINTITGAITGFDLKMTITSFSK